MKIRPPLERHEDTPKFVPFIKFLLPLPANRGNARWHWRTEKKLKDEYFLRATVQAPWRPVKPYPRVAIVVVMYTWSKMDRDNLYARLKWPLDWLQLRGVIVDDSDDTLIWRDVSQAIDRKNQRLEIFLGHPISVTEV